MKFPRKEVVPDGGQDTEAVAQNDGGQEIEDDQYMLGAPYLLKMLLRQTPASTRIRKTGSTTFIIT